MSSSFNASDDIDPFKHDTPESPSPHLSPPLPAEVPLPPDEDGPESGSSPSSSAPPPPPHQPSQPSQHASSSSPPPPPPTRAYNNRHNSYENASSSLGRYLQQDGWTIEITDAYKTTEGGSSAYIVYVCRTGTVEARRRYSEFESLRSSLAKLYPTLIVPPIPSKTTVSEYAVKQNKAKEDAAVIARRTRMLNTFLNRVGRHPILGNDTVFHRFLDGGVSWTEILHSPPLSQLPKNSLKAPAHDPTDSSSAAAYASLPNPSAAQPLKAPDQRFQESEAFTNKFEKHLSGSMERVNRRVMKRWGEQSNDYAELGAVLNGFSLTEEGSLSAAIERSGQAVDATYLSTTNLLQNWESSWTEPLTDYVAFGSIIKKLLAYRHQKNVQFEMTVDQIESKKISLEQLERSEDEARRLEGALAAAGVGGGTTPPTAAGSAGGSSAAGGGRGGRTGGGARSGAGSSGGSGGYGFLSALSHSITGMIDVDPEATRRNNISKTRESISQLEDALHLSAQDLKYASQTIQADLDRFQRQKVADVRNMSIALATAHRDWCKQNLEAWEEARKAIDAIEPHPANPPNQAPKPTKSPPPRRASATWQQQAPAQPRGKPQRVMSNGSEGAGLQ